MSKRYCPQCGKLLTENARFCIHCGNAIPDIDSESTEESAVLPSDSSGDDVSDSSSAESATNTSDESTTVPSSSAASSSSQGRQARQRKKKRKLPIGYLIFLALMLFILIWLINKKMTTPEPKPMHSLPSERPIINQDFVAVDSLDSLVQDTLYEDEISLLSPSLPRINIPEHPTPAPLEDDDTDYDDDVYSDPVPSTYTESSEYEVRPSTTLQLTTEQSVRNMLVSNRFVDPISSDVLTFRNNGNLLLKNGDTIAVDMEVSKLTKNSAVLDYYNDNKSWDIHLDITGHRKQLSWMENTYISD